MWNLLSSGAYPLPTSTSINGPSRFPSITDQLNTPLNWENGIMWNYTIPPMYTTDANGNRAVSTPSVVGADGQYIILSRGKSSARATGTENYEMEGFPLTAFSMVTNANLTYAANLCNQLGQTSAAFYNAAASPAWVTDLPLPAYDQTYPGSASLRSDGNIIYPVHPCLPFMTTVKVQDSCYGRINPSRMISLCRHILGHCCLGHALHERLRRIHARY